MLEGWDPVNLFHHTSWLAIVTPADRPKSVRNRCVIEVFRGVFMLSSCFLMLLPNDLVRSLPCSLASLKKVCFTSNLKILVGEIPSIFSDDSLKLSRVWKICKIKVHVQVNTSNWFEIVSCSIYMYITMCIQGKNLKRKTQRVMKTITPSLMFRFTPLCINKDTVSISPFLAAQWRGFLPWNYTCKLYTMVVRKIQGHSIYYEIVGAEYRRNI